MERVKALTDGAGVDVAIEAVGVPGSFDLCQDIVAPGGHVANVGVHGRPVELHLERLWAHNVTLTTRLVDTVTTPMLLKLLLSDRLDAERLVTHRFGMSDMMKAYDTFANAAKEKASRSRSSAAERRATPQAVDPEPSSVQPCRTASDRASSFE